MQAPTTYKPTMDFSVVVPFYNEEDSVIPLCEGIRGAVEPLGRTFEVLLVDDGSTDHTFAKCCHVAETDSRFRVLKLRANFGQTPALTAGFSHAQGNVVVSMDGDLQNDPLDIEQMLSRIDDGYDVVTGWREKRQDKLVVRKVPSLVANWLVRKVTGTSIHDNGCGLRAYRRSVIAKLSLYSEMHRLLPTVIALTGARIAEVKVRHHPRRFGSSKYNLTRIYKFLLDFTALKIIMTLFRLPLFGFGAAGILFVSLGALLFGVGVMDALLRPDGALIILLGAGALVGCLGTTLIMMGVICDLLYETGTGRVERLLRVDLLQ